MPIVDDKPARGKGKDSVESASTDLDLNDLNLDELDFSKVGDPDAAPDVPDVDAGELPWEDSVPDVPGEDDLGLEDLGVPGDTEAGLLAEYLPPIRASLETLSGQVQDYHAFSKTRAESVASSFKAMHDALASKLDSVESAVTELTAQVRLLVQGTAPAAPEGKPVSKPDKPTSKPPAAPKQMTVAEVGAQLKITKPDLPTILSALSRLAEGKGITVDQFRGWLTTKNGLTENQAGKIVDLLKVKGPITNATFK